MVTANESTAPPYPIAAVDNALQALQLVKEHGTVRVTDVGHELGIARSSAHRLLSMLAYRGYLRQDPETKAYGPGPALVELGLTVVREMDIRRAARPVMERLAGETRETTSLVLLDGTDVLFVDCVEGPRSLRVGSRTGLTMPAHCTSAGKAMLAAMPAERLHRLYSGPRLRTMTERSISTLAELEAELAGIRKAGYATNQSESEDGITAIGMALPDDGTRPLAGFSVAGPAARLGRAQVREAAAALERGVAELTAASGR